MRITCLFILAIVFLLPVTAQAYIGPGLGLGAITAFFGLLFSIFLAVIGIFWYPIKRIIKKIRNKIRNKKVDQVTLDDSE